MTRGQAYYREQILEDVWVRVFTATNTAMMEYPYVLGNPDECSPTLASMAETYIMDSKIGDESVQNEDVIRRGKDIGADVITPADVIHDPQTTTERIVDLFVQLDECDEYDPEVLIPLQPNPAANADHVDHYYMVRDWLQSCGVSITEHRLSVGGVKEWSAAKQLETLCQVRAVVGDEQYLHGLGFGATSDWIATLRKCPSLVDSLDMSSIVKDIVSSQKLLTPNFDRVEYPLPRGSNSTVVSVMLREFVLYLMSYLLGPHPRQEDVPTTIQNEKMRSIVEQYSQENNTTQDSQDVSVQAD